MRVLRWLVFLNAMVVTLASSSLLFGQTSQISGKVTDLTTGEPLANVNIVLHRTSYGAASSKLGDFNIRNLPAGEYTLVASRIGYRSVQQKITIKAGIAQHTSIVMSVQPIELSEVIVARVMLTGGQNQVEAIPGAVHYIGTKELARNNNHDIHRVLREIPGVNIQEEDGYGLRPNIGLRGTGVERSQKITLLEDGVLIAPAPYSAPAAYYFPTVGRMQGIEVRKGSSQIKYGPYTTGGALNMISTPIPAAFHGRVNISAGERSERNIHVTVGDSYKNLGFLVETYQMKANGFKELDGGGDTGFDKKDYLVKLRVNTNKNAKNYQALTIKLGQTDEVSNETYLGLTDADFELTPNRRYAGSQKDQMNSEHKQFQIRHFVQLNRSLDFTTTLYRNEFRRNWYKLEKARSAVDGKAISISGILSDPITNADEYAILTGFTSVNENALEVKNNNRKYNSQGIQSVLGLQFNRFGGAHEIEMGMRYHRDEMDRFQWVDTFSMDNGVMMLTQPGTPGTESNRIEKANALAVYLQYKLSTGKLTFIPGVRYEDIKLSRKDYGKSDPDRSGANLTKRENKVNVFIPGMGLNYEFTESFSLFLGIHRGFAPPGSKEGAKPEESINYELGLRFAKSAMTAQSVFFYNDYQNLLGSDLAATGGQGSTDLFNGGEVDVKGMEFMLNYELGLSKQMQLSIPMRVSYTYTNARFKSNFISDYEPWEVVRPGDELPYLPKHQLAASAGLARETWNFNISTKYVSKMRTQSGSGSFVASQSVGAHLIVDANLEYTLTTKSRLFIGIKNISNEEYIVARRPAGVRPGLPRTFMGGIKTDF
jgi:Fe(3+) dicitrate transport protein